MEKASRVEVLARRQILDGFWESSPERLRMVVIRAGVRRMRMGVTVRMHRAVSLAPPTGSTAMNNPQWAQSNRANETDSGKTYEN
jgi:hypothetical protein